MIRWFIKTILKKYSNSSQFTIADISAIPMVSNINLLIPVTEESWPKLYHWFNVVKARTSYEKANVPGLNELKFVLQQSTDHPIAWYSYISIDIATWVFHEIEIKSNFNSNKNKSIKLIGITFVCNSNRALVLWITSSATVALGIMQHDQSKKPRALRNNPIFITNSKINLQLGDGIEGSGSESTASRVRNKWITTAETAKSLEVVDSVMRLQSYLFEMNQINNAFFEFQILFLIILCLIAMIGVGYTFLAIFFNQISGMISQSNTLIYQRIQ